MQKGKLVDVENQGVQAEGIHADLERMVKQGQVVLVVQLQLRLEHK